MAAINEAAAGSRSVDQRHFVVPANLADLHGPAGGQATLDWSLDWSRHSTYDLDDAGDLQVMYQTVLDQTPPSQSLAAP